MLATLFRQNKITGWRRHLLVRSVEGGLRNLGARVASLRTSRSALRTFSVRPDFVFREVRLAVFVDGCFWHGCPRHGTQPKGNAAFWRKKISINRARDRRVNRVLRRAGWHPLRVWEHELKNKDCLLARLRRALQI